MTLAILLGPERKTVLFVAYSDETGADDASPNAVVATVLMNMDSQWPPVIAALENLQPNRHSEIKGRQLFRDLRYGRNRERADKLLAGVLNIAFDNRLPVFQAAVDRAGFKKYMTYMQTPKNAPDVTPYDLAFAICLHGVDVWVHTGFPKDQVVWISDDAGHYEKKITDALAVWRGNAKAGVPLHQMGPQAIHIADTIYFGSSKASRALQVADVCCSVIREHLIQNPDAERYYRLLLPQLQNEFPALYSEMAKGRNILAG